MTDFAKIWEGALNSEVYWVDGGPGPDVAATMTWWDPDRGSMCGKAFSLTEFYKPSEDLWPMFMNQTMADGGKTWEALNLPPPPVDFGKLLHDDSPPSYRSALMSTAMGIAFEPMEREHT